MRVAQEEVFGPFLTVIPFRDEKDAIAIANDVKYGLAGYVWTADMGRALRVADALEAGLELYTSDYFTMDHHHPPMLFAQGSAAADAVGRAGAAVLVRAGFAIFSAESARAAVCC